VKSKGGLLEIRQLQQMAQSLAYYKKDSTFPMLGYALVFRKGHLEG